MTPALRPIAALVAATALTVGASALPGIGLGRTQGPPARGQAAPGAAEDLLKTPAFDRITLSDGKVLAIEPVRPRPLPPYVPPKDDPEKKFFRAITKQEVAEEQAAERLPIRLADGDFRDYTVKRIHIKNVEYFEDMLLAAADRAIAANDHAHAFELLLAVKERSPAWKGLDERLDRLLYGEGSATLVGLVVERGLRLLRELYTRRPDYPGLSEKLARAYSERITRLFDAGLYADARKSLHELATLLPGHVLTRDARERFVAKARSLATLAAEARGGDRLDALTEALRVWPGLESAAPPYEAAFRERPTLDVGVLDVPRARPDDRDPAPGFGPWARSPAEARVVGLVYRPLARPAGEAGTTGPGPEPLAEEVEIGDIGRTAAVRLRRGIAWSDGSRDVSSIDVARTLTDRASPRSPGFSARWAGLLDRLDIVDDDRLTIRLTRPVARPEAWLVTPIGPAHAGKDGLVPGPEGRRTVGDGPFRVAELGRDFARFRAARDGSGASIRHLREVRLPNAAAAVAAIVRGEVTLLEHVPPDRLADLAADPEIRLGLYARPSLHVLAVDGRNPALRNRSLRRGLALAIDRKTLLEESVLRRPIDPKNAPADGPFPAESPANDGDVRPIAADALTAKMLVAAGRKELGGDPIRLRLEYPAIPEAQAAIPRIVEALREAGLVGDVAGLIVEPVERHPAELERELRAGRPFDLAYRATRAGDPTTDAGPLICPGYDAPPEADALASIASPRMLQLLLQLERTVDDPTARELLRRIDREARDELPVIPLWQLEDRYAWRTRLTGPAERADALYDGIETWEVRPWFARDPWSP